RHRRGRPRRLRHRAAARAPGGPGAVGVLMRRALWPLALLAALATLAPAAHASATGAVDHQAWAQTAPVPTFVADDGRIYVAADLGQESARAFVHLDASSIGPGTVVRLGEAPADSTLPDKAAAVACPLASAFAADGKMA